MWNEADTREMLNRLGGIEASLEQITEVLIRIEELLTKDSDADTHDQ